MGAWLSTDNWSGSAIILAGALVSVFIAARVSKRGRFLRQNKIMAYFVAFLIAFVITFGAGFGGMVYASGKRCAPATPAKWDVAKLALVPAALTGLVTVIAQIVADATYSPTVMMVATLIRYLGPLVYIFGTMPGVIGAIPCPATK